MGSPSILVSVVGVVAVCYVAYAEIMDHGIACTCKDIDSSMLYTQALLMYCNYTTQNNIMLL